MAVDAHSSTTSGFTYTAGLDVVMVNSFATSGFVRLITNHVTP